MINSDGSLNMDGSQAGNGYRYTMPQLVLTQEGKKRKVLSNLGSVSEKVGRTCEMLLAFFNHELSALRGTAGCEIKPNGVISVPRFMEQSVLQQAVLDFIQKHVMCKSCQNPETRIFALQNGTTVLECDACGGTAPSAHRASPDFFQWMQEHPQHLKRVGGLDLEALCPLSDEATWSFPQSSDAVASDDWVS
jgi:translation initiation factor 5